MTDPLQECILTMNRGSATLKSALYAIGNTEELLLSMMVDEGGDSGDRLRISDPSGTSLFDSVLDRGDSNAAIEKMFSWMGAHNFLTRLTAAGHRLLQGGPRHTRPQQITPEFLSELEQLAPLDPDHLPAAIWAIQYIAAKFPALPQVACFDTAFHESLSRVARMYALPRRFYERGIVRHGFHGLSYEYVMSELGARKERLANGRVIIAHLGSGAGMVAVKAGKSVDTSMGFTPIEGLVMSTRCGDLDPGVILYLLEHKKMSAEEISTLVNKQSGLLGVSETSGDMRTLIDRTQNDPMAAEALELFCYRAKKYIGSYAAVLGGVDLLVFVGGIGEHAPIVRDRICAGLEFLGVQLEVIS